MYYFEAISVDVGQNIKSSHPKGYNIPTKMRNRPIKIIMR